MAKGDRLQRITVMLTQDSVRLLRGECERRRRAEGCKVPPARIINELIIRYLSRDPAQNATHEDHGEAPKVIKTAARGQRAS